MNEMNLLKKAHQLTKEIKREYPEVDYKAQLGICISFLYNNKEVEEMDIKKQLQDAVVEAVEEFGADDYTWNKWEKEDKKRIYISLKWYRKGRTSKEVKCGYLDLVTMEYITENKYTRQYDLLKKEYV